MNATEAHAVLLLLFLAHDRPIPEGLDKIWAATLGDIPFLLAKDAALELVKTLPYVPKVAEVRDRARLIKAERERADQRRRQLEGRAEPLPPAVPGRTGAAMCAHVLGRLADAGQDITNGVYLGKERAEVIAEAAVREWLDKHPRPPVDEREPYGDNVIPFGARA